MKKIYIRGPKVTWTPTLENELRGLWARPELTAAEVAAQMGLRIDQVRDRARQFRLRKARRNEIPYPVRIDPCGRAAIFLPGAGGHWTFVDQDILHWFRSTRWYVHSEKGALYVWRADRRKLHRLLLAAPPGQLIDHIDRNGLNNCLSNLRFASDRQNSHNSGPRRNARSIYKGVWLHISGRYGGAVTDPNGIRRSIGYYSTEREAARAHDALAKHFRGEYAFQNLPDDPMGPDEIAANPYLQNSIRLAYVKVRDRREDAA